VIQKEIGDRYGEACSYGNLANGYQSVGEYKKASDCSKEALTISRNIGDRKT